MAKDPEQIHDTRSDQVLRISRCPQDDEGESQYFEAGFVRFQNTAPLGVLLDSFRQPDIDSCAYHQQARGDSTPLEIEDELELPGYSYEFVSAGTEIDVSKGHRVYSRLKRTSSD